MRALVLEDDPTRVRWLRRIAPALAIDHEAEVEPFLERSRERRYELVILDHDLGGGLDGRTAATFLDARGAPIVVWSQNELRAEDMRAILASRGQNVAAVVPFGAPNLTTAIKTLLGLA